MLERFSANYKATLDIGELSEALESLYCLERKFSGWQEDQTSRAAAWEIFAQHLVQHGQEDSGRFPAAGLGRDHDILAFKDCRDCAALDFGCVIEAKSVQRFKQLLMKRQSLQRCQV